MSKRVTPHTGQYNLDPRAIPLSGIPNPTASIESLHHAVIAIKETLETISRARGNQANSAVYVRDLEPLVNYLSGLFESKTGSVVQALAIFVEPTTADQTSLQAAADLNATDFSTYPPPSAPDWDQQQIEGTTVRIRPNNTVSVAHNQILYSYIGPKNVHVGVGGDHTVLEAELVGVSTSDHGSLSGLADDDHPQYLTQLRAEALFLLQGGIAGHQLIKRTGTNYEYDWGIPDEGTF